MSAPAIVSLDSFFSRDRDTRKVASLAAELGTDREATEQSTWANSDYGGYVHAIRTLPGATLALTAEVQRICDRHAPDIQVHLDSDGVHITATLLLSERGLLRG